MDADVLLSKPKRRLAKFAWSKTGWASDKEKKAVLCSHFLRAASKPRILIFDSHSCRVLSLLHRIQCSPYLPSHSTHLLQPSQKAYSIEQDEQHRTAGWPTLTRLRQHSFSAHIRGFEEATMGSSISAHSRSFPSFPCCFLGLPTGRRKRGKCCIYKAALVTTPSFPSSVSSTL